MLKNPGGQILFGCQTSNSIRVSKFKFHRGDTFFQK